MGHLRKMIMNIFRKKQKDILPASTLPQKETVEPTVVKETKTSLPRILIYGTERVGIEHPNNIIVNRDFELEFSSFDTTNKFQNYDGVVLFQSTFERMKYVENPYSESYLDVKYNRDELVRRRNELSQLLEKGGFVCFLIHSHFIDYTRYEHDLKNTDLTKIYLNIDSFFRESLNGDYLISKIYRSEFGQFLKNYGIARVKYNYYSDWLDKNIRKICGIDSYNLTGFILFDNRYFIPCRLPSKDEVEQFFMTLVSALVATSKKLVQEIPSWVDEYKFKEEEKILDEEVKLQKQIEELNNKKDIYKRHKRCLCYDGELLVESVTEILKEGFGLNLDDKKDEHLEDRAILDDKNNEVALIEIKGSNENIKNPNIYQADSHRGRREKPADFPSVLIVNTFIKPSNSIQEKLREIGSEQIKLAVDKKVLVMRSIDLLNLLYLKEDGKVKKEEIIGILTKEYGWLCVSQDNYEVKNQ